MNDVALVPISWIRAVCFAFALAVVGVFFLGRCSAPEPRGLPAKVQARVTRHEVLSVVDTAAVNRLEREKAASRRRELAATAARRVAEDSAAAKGRRADSLEIVAKAAQTSADSAAAWERAYYVRSGEVADLQLGLKDAALEAKELRFQRDSTAEQSAIWKAHALRGDTVIAQLRPLAEAAGDRCKIIGPIRCPSRKQTAIAAAVATIAVSLKISR